MAVCPRGMSPAKNEEQLYHALQGVERLKSNKQHFMYKKLWLIDATWLATGMPMRGQ